MCATSRADAGSALSHTSTLSQSLSLLKWLLALSVVADHFLRFNDVAGAGGVVYTLGDNPSAKFLGCAVFVMLKNYAVPVFFVVSGYLFYGTGAFEAPALRGKLRRRLTTLLWPYMLWNILGLCVFALSDYLAGNSVGAAVSNATGGWTGFFAGFVNTPDSYFPHNTPLWYIRDLLVCMVLSPAMVWCLRKAGVVFLGICAGLFLCLFLDYGGQRWTVPLLFFNLGLWLRMRNVTSFRAGRRTLLALIALYVVTAAYYAYFNNYPGMLSHPVRNLSMIVFVFVMLCGCYAIAARLPKTTRTVAVLDFLAAASFFVYVAHYAPLENFKSLVFNIIEPQTPGAETLTLVLGYVLLVAVLVLIFAALRRWCRPLVRLLLGRG